MLKHKFIKVDKNELLIKNLSALMYVYGGVELDDDIVLENMDKLSKDFNTHWFELKNSDKGLNYYGITIILNKDLNCFVDVLNKLDKKYNVQKLVLLCEEARNNGENIVHFGI